MKKWISYILVSFLLLAAFPSLMVSAETAASGKLIAKGNDITVTLNLPQGKTETITSLHLQMYVSIDIGSMDKPTFQFSDSIVSTIEDAEAIEEVAGNYIVDVIISGKKDQDIFNNSEQVEIGTLSLNPTSNEFKMVVGIAGETADSTEPVIRYVNSNGQSAQTVSLTETSPVTITNASTPSYPSYIGGGSVAPTVPTTPDDSETPGTPDDSNTTTTPTEPITPATPVTPEAPTEEAPNETDSTAQTFNSTKKPTLKATVTKGSKSITFKWSKVAGADGYRIYQYNSNTGKYERIKTISDQATTTYSKNMSYASSYSFRIRAFKITEDGSKTYGKYSAVIHVTTPPNTVKGLKVKSSSTSKVTLSWKKVKNAEGYQIFRSKKKNGTYTRVKTLKKGSTLKATIKQTGKKTYYYKIRAYVSNADNNRVYGSYCTAVASKS